MRGSTRRRGRRAWLGPVRFLVILWAAFAVDSCARPEERIDPRALDGLRAPPRLQIGLSKFLRVESAAAVFPEAYRVSGAAGDLLRGEGGRGPVEIACDPSGLRFGTLVVPERALRVSSGTAGFELGGIAYGGELLVVRDDDRATGAPRLTLVNDVDLETYLEGVVGKEMSLSAGEEALKAQVIAARTYALAEARQKTLRNVRGEMFDLYDDERSQVYAGRERATGKAIDLVRGTRGQFLVYEDRIFKTYYSSTCGGHTAPAREVLGESASLPPLAGTSCGFCGHSKHYKWSARFPRAELARKLFGDSPPGAIRDIRISRSLPGGRAQEVAVALEGFRQERLLHANDGFRRKLDPRAIRSTLWESVRWEGDALVIDGRGWGHGVGMCQYGAYGMADQGRSASEILEHYFPGARVRKIY